MTGKRKSGAGLPLETDRTFVGRMMSLQIPNCQDADQHQVFGVGESSPSPSPYPHPQHTHTRLFLYV